MLYVVIFHERAVSTTAPNTDLARLQAVEYFDIDDEEIDHLRFIPIPVVPKDGEVLGLDVRH